MLRCLSQNCPARPASRVVISHGVPRCRGQILQRQRDNCNWPDCSSCNTSSKSRCQNFTIILSDGVTAGHQHGRYLHFPGERRFAAARDAVASDTMSAAAANNFTPPRHASTTTSEILRQRHHVIHKSTSFFYLRNHKASTASRCRPHVYKSSQAAAFEAVKREDFTFSKSCSRRSIVQKQETCTF